MRWATLYNMVGFQTKMKYGEQTRVFKTIPGLENAVFARLGGLHRNTFINSPQLLNKDLSLMSSPRKRGSVSSQQKDPRLHGESSDKGQTIRFAGQITGCEGYVESAAVGLMAGRMAAADIQGASYDLPPPTTAFGALINYITGDADAETFQPMNINFGLFPPPAG